MNSATSWKTELFNSLRDRATDTLSLLRAFPAVQCMMDGHQPLTNRGADGKEEAVSTEIGSNGLYKTYLCKRCKAAYWSDML